jgi:hypothetical protein
MFFALNAFVFITNQVDWRHVYFIESSQHVSFWQLLISLLLYDATSIILYALYHENLVPEGTAFTASSLVILPALPVPVMDAGAIFFV